MDTGQIITAVIAGGGAASLIATLGKTYTAMRAGARTRQIGDYADTQAARHAAEVSARDAERRADFWHDVAGRYGYQLRQAGIDPDPPAPHWPADSADFWHDVAGRYRYQLREAGVEPDPERPQWPPDGEPPREHRPRER